MRTIDEDGRRSFFWEKEERSASHKRSRWMTQQRNEGWPNSNLARCTGACFLIPRPQENEILWAKASYLCRPRFATGNGSIHQDYYFRGIKYRRKVEIIIRQVSRWVTDCANEWRWCQVAWIRCFQLGQVFRINANSWDIGGTARKPQVFLGERINNRIFYRRNIHQVLEM